MNPQSTKLEFEDTKYLAHIEVVSVINYTATLNPGQQLDYYTQAFQLDAGFEKNASGIVKVYWIVYAPFTMTRQIIPRLEQDESEKKKIEKKFFKELNISTIFIKLNQF